MKMIMKSKIHMLIAVAVIISVLIIPAVKLSAQENPVIMLYGTDQCGFCQAMKRNLDAEKIAYTFYDINKDKTKGSEMWKKVYSAYPSRKGGVTFPVMDISGKILISPGFDEVKSLIGSGGAKKETDDSSADKIDNKINAITLYGTDQCGFCQAMKRNLDAEKISYTFYDINKDKTKGSEMWTKVYSAYPSRKGGVTFPVMDIGGKILISPGFDEVKSLLGSGDARNETDDMTDKRNNSIIIPNQDNDVEFRNLEEMKKASVIFQNRYYKSNVWDAQRLPASPVADQNWRLLGFKNPGESKTRSYIDWGKAGDRYLAFDIEEDEKNNPSSITDDIFNSGKKFRVVLNLFENDGTKVKTISDWGKLIGFGSAGFMYMQEGVYGTMFTNESYKLNNSLTYKPDLANVTKLSEIAEYSYRQSERKN